MDRPPHDYAAAMAFAQQQQAAKIQTQQQHLGFHHQHQQFPPPGHGPPFLPVYPSVQMYPFNRHMQPHHPPPMHLLHPHPLHLQQPPPPPATAFPSLPPPNLPQFWGPYDSAPPPAGPPPDPDLQKRIEKLVEYAAKNGPEFESMIREKQRDNPAYGFLFGGEGSGYYYYKLWLSTRGGGVVFSHTPPPTSMMHPPPPPPLPTHFNGLPSGGPVGSAGVVGAPQMMHPAPYPSLYDQQLQGQHQPQPHFDNTGIFKGLSGPLPSDVALELNNVLSNLTGTKESIKGAKMWFMQRSPFAPALAEALRDRFFALDESERQLHIIYLANDILFDRLQRRANPRSLDNEALAFRQVLGPMLSRIYHNPQNREENQARLQKILHFWGSKEVYDPPTIAELESEMLRAPPPPGSLPDPPNDTPYASADLPAPAFPQQYQLMANGVGPPPALSENKEGNSFPQPVDQPETRAGFPPDPAPPGSVPAGPSQAANVLLPGAPNPLEKVSPYPLFPPGLIPGMVRKMQIGSGVPYSPLSPLDIPTSIPPSTASPSRVLDLVSKFFREVGEVNPSQGPVPPALGPGEGCLPTEPVRLRKGGACIPPPAALAIETDALAATAAFAESVEDRDPTAGPGRARPGGSQYDDVYTSYRKQRSSTYHSSLGVRAV